MLASLERDPVEPFHLAQPLNMGVINDQVSVPERQPLVVRALQRHTAASQVIEDGDNVEEAAWLLGHKDSTVTRRVYVDEIKSRERSSKRRAKLEARMGPTLTALEGSAGGSAKADQPRPVPTTEKGKVVPLKRHAA